MRWLMVALRSVNARSSESANTLTVRGMFQDVAKKISVLLGSIEGSVSLNDGLALGVTATFSPMELVRRTT